MRTRTPEKSQSNSGAGLVFLVIVAVALYFVWPTIENAFVGAFVAGGFALTFGLIFLKCVAILGLFGFGLFLLSTMLFPSKKRR